MHSSLALTHIIQSPPNHDRVAVVTAFHGQSANDNNAMSPGRKLAQRLRRLSPITAFTAGFSVAGFLVAFETTLRLTG